ncbi:MAG: dTDP-4-dehydrorhamnose reductase [Actinomycetia bacterium]|nr:dTDP-4-dehydrorhamnose reductase [Actinomycetes bacterium]
MGAEAAVMAASILITGSGGQLGRELTRLLPGAIALDHGRLDVSDRRSVHEAIASHRPDIVIHTAAMTAVDACETDVDAAFEVNGLACRWLVEACERNGGRIVAVSTDYVFSGEPGAEPRPWTEWDPTRPRSVYGRSKLAGELELRPTDSIVRTAWLAGPLGDNTVKTVLRLAASETAMSFVNDQIGSPTFAPDLAEVIVWLVEHEIPGVVHAVNRGSASWFDYAQNIVKAAGYDPGLVSPIGTDELLPPRPAPRPAYSVLDDMVLRSVDHRMPHYLESLDRLISSFAASL